MVPQPPPLHASPNDGRLLWLSSAVRHHVWFHRALALTRTDCTSCSRGRRMPMPSLEFMSGSMLTSIVVFHGSGSIIPGCFMIAREDLPSFQPAFSTFLLRTVWTSMQPRAPGCCSAGSQGAQDRRHDDARATGRRAPAVAHGAGAAPAPFDSIASAVFLVNVFWATWT